MLIFHTNIIRSSTQIVDICHSQLIRETEQQLLVNLLGRDKIENHFRRISIFRSEEKLRQSLLLRIQFLEHYLQLLTIFRHKVCLSACELITTFAYLHDILRHQLRHLGFTTRSKYFGIHKVARIQLLRFRTGNECLGCRFVLTCHVYCQQNTFLIQIHMIDITLTIHFNGKHLCRIGHPD